MNPFERSLKKFGKKAMDRHVKVKRMAAFDLFSSIVISTPVAKGVLRNNWFASIGTGSNEITKKGNASQTQQVTVGNIETVLGSTEAEKDTFLTNNLDYASRIEFDGYSWRVPQGMVRVNTARWSKIVSASAIEEARGR
jgi:hypothetical protein